MPKESVASAFLPNSTRPPSDSKLDIARNAAVNSTSPGAEVEVR